MDHTAALNETHRVAATEFAAAVKDRNDAIEHLEELIARMKRDSADGNFYSNNLAAAASDVTRAQERAVANLKTMQMIDQMRESL